MIVVPSYFKKAASTIAYPFLYTMGLAIGVGVLLWEKRLLAERISKRQSYWLAGVDDEDLWPTR
jgi:hypothetical protein